MSQQTTIINEPIMMAVCCDLSGQVRGKGFPLREREKRFKRGVGWVPTNSLITCFNSIAEGPYGSLGDLLLMPDPGAEVCVEFADNSPAERFVLSDITSLQGQAWNCCPRNILRSALNQLFEETGLRLKVAFEHEFWYSAAAETHWCGFGLGSFRRHSGFAETLLAALRSAGLVPDTFLAEFGASQFEITVAPTIGVRAADECLIVRELVRAVVSRAGEQVSFSPIVNPDVGNGLHIHISLVDADGTPATYQYGNDLKLSPLAANFFAGVRKYLPAITALTAASVISYQRLKPHRWSAAYNNIAVRDREAALRICPVVEQPGFEPESQYHVEFRAADATANPYVQLAAITRAGLQGIHDQLPAPRPTVVDLSVLSQAELDDLDIERLPENLPAALHRMQREPLIREWFTDEFIDLYLAHKNGEIQYLNGKDDDTIRDMYAQVY